MDCLIMEPGKPVFWAFGLCWVLLAVLWRRIFIKKSLRVRKIFLFIYGLANIALYFVYKGRLLLDTEYAAIIGKENYGWIDELPLHLCNVMMLIYPLAIVISRKRVFAFLFYTGVLGVFLAIFMPSDGFPGYSLLLERVLGYYSYHWMLFTEMLLLLLLGLYEPDYKDILPAAVSGLAAAFAAYLVDKLLILTGISPTANYWYVVNPNGIGIFEFFHKIIPTEFLYISLCEVIMIPGYTIMTFVCKKCALLASKKTGESRS